MNQAEARRQSTGLAIKSRIHKRVRLRAAEDLIQTPSFLANKDFDRLYRETFCAWYDVPATVCSVFRNLEFGPHS